MTNITPYTICSVACKVKCYIVLVCRLSYDRYNASLIMYTSLNQYHYSSKRTSFVKLLKIPFAGSLTKTIHYPIELKELLRKAHDYGLKMAM